MSPDDIKDAERFLGGVWGPDAEDCERFASRYGSTLLDIARAQLPDTPRARMEFLRDFLKELPDERFNIRNLFTGGEGENIEEKDFNVCGTAACVKGWSRYLFGKVATLFGARWGEELGLDEMEADALFMPEGFVERPRRFTRLAAIRVLDIYLAEQVVDWERAIAETAVSHG